MLHRQGCPGRSDCEEGMGWARPCLSTADVRQGVGATRWRRRPPPPRPRRRSRLMETMATSASVALLPSPRVRDGVWARTPGVAVVARSPAVGAASGGCATPSSRHQPSPLRRPQWARVVAPPPRQGWSCGGGGGGGCRRWRRSAAAAADASGGGREGRSAGDGLSTGGTIRVPSPRTERRGRRSLRPLRARRRPPPPPPPLAAVTRRRCHQRRPRPPRRGRRPPATRGGGGRHPPSRPAVAPPSAADWAAAPTQPRHHPARSAAAQPPLVRRRWRRRRRLRWWGVGTVGAPARRREGRQRGEQRLFFLTWRSAWQCKACQSMGGATCDHKNCGEKRGSVPLQGVFIKVLWLPQSLKLPN